MLGVTWKREIQIYQFSLRWLTPVHLRNDERKEGSSLFGRNRQAELQIITWSIGVMLASIIIDSVAAVLKDLLTAAPLSFETILTVSLNFTF
jgi:hypothetical protein